MRRAPDQICAMCREWKFSAASAAEQAAGVGICGAYAKPMLWSESSVLFVPTSNTQARRAWIESFKGENNGK